MYVNVQCLNEYFLFFSVHIHQHDVSIFLLVRLSACIFFIRSSSLLKKLSMNFLEIFGDL